MTGMIVLSQKSRPFDPFVWVTKVGASVLCALVLFGTARAELLARLPETVGVPDSGEAIEAPRQEALNPNGRTEASPPVLKLADAEAMALSSHPKIAEAAARIRGARCNCLQVGLPPNPTAGYVATEMGSDGQAGQQGLFVGQRFVRGNKLGLNRAVASREVMALEQQYAVERMRVLTEVRTVYVEVFLAQREVELANRLVEVSTQATESVRRLISAQEAKRTDLLQAEIEEQRISARLVQATATLQAGWRRLAAVIGQPHLPQRTVSVDSKQLAWPLAWQDSLDRLLTSSPEVAKAMADVTRAQAAWRRARAEPIPDVDAQLSVQYDSAADETLASVEIGMPLPLWNRNQGAIGQACQEVVAAKRRLDAVELRLTQQLATTFQQYESAQAKAETYRTGILQRAEENMNLVKQAFASGEASFLDLLTVQRTYFESNLDYLRTLQDVNKSVQLLGGMMLSSDP